MSFNLHDHSPTPGNHERKPLEISSLKRFNFSRTEGEDGTNVTLPDVGHFFNKAPAWRQTGSEDGSLFLSWKEFRGDMRYRPFIWLFWC